MTEEEYFRKNYPDSCWGDRPLSPYWDYFQDGVEFGERQSEEKIEELENENAELKKEWQEQVQKATDEGYARTQLQIENDKLKEQIEKMKCCFNCKHSRTEYEHCRTDKYEKWELTE